MTLVAMRPDTAMRRVRLVWFATADGRSCANHEAMLGQVQVDGADMATLKVDPRDEPTTIVENAIIVMPTTLIEVDGREVLRFAGTPTAAAVTSLVERSLALSDSDEPHRRRALSSGAWPSADSDEQLGDAGPPGAGRRPGRFE